MRERTEAPPPSEQLNHPVLLLFLSLSTPVPVLEVSVVATTTNELNRRDNNSRCSVLQAPWQQQHAAPLSLTKLKPAPAARARLWH